MSTLTKKELIDIAELIQDDLDNREAGWDPGAHAYFTTLVNKIKADLENEGLSLFDEDDEKEVQVRVEEQDASGQCILIGIEGYADYYGCDQVIMLSIEDGTLILRAWADKNVDDPTHKITFKRAKE